MSLREIEELERAKHAYEAEIRALERQIPQHDMSRATSRQDMQRVDEENQRLRRENDNLKREVRNGVMSGTGANNYIRLYRDLLGQENRRLSDEYNKLYQEFQSRSGRFSSSQSSNPREISRLQGVNDNLNRQIRTLQRTNSALKTENDAYVKRLQAAGKDTVAKKTILDVLKLASDALQASTSAEHTASSAKTEAENLINLADAAATNANNSDLGSAAALAAGNAAKKAKDAQKDVVKEVGKVQKASSDVETWAKKFIADPSKVTDNAKTSLSTAKGELTKQLNALNAAIEKVKKASTDATKQGEIAMNIHDNWESLGPLFGFKPPPTKGVKDKGKVETKPLPTTGAGGNGEAITIDNWGFIQQKFGIPKTSAPAASTPGSSAPAPTSGSSTPAPASGSSAPAATK